MQNITCYIFLVICMLGTSKGSNLAEILTRLSKENENSTKNTNGIAFIGFDGEKLSELRSNLSRNLEEIPQIHLKLGNGWGKAKQLNRKCSLIFIGLDRTDGVSLNKSDVAE